MVSSSSLFCATCGAANSLQATTCFACGQPLHASDNAEQPAAGLILRQRYHTLCQLGQGGMGAVYRAEDTELGNRIVAVKEMSLRGLSQPEEEEAAQAFKREALLLAGLMHPNLPRIYDHFAEVGRWYLVMDFIEGQTLEDYLEKAPEGMLPVKEALEIGIQLCTVLDYLHTRQPAIIFRDLKPSNIMRTPAGQLYLIDFGIARHFKPGQAKDTTAFGSPGYAAPEQYGKTQTTPSADLYSLGALLHQALTGIDPSITPFFFAPPATGPAALQTLLMQMLNMDMRKRPASATAIKEELQQLAVQELTRPTSHTVPPAATGASVPRNPHPSSLRALHTLSHRLYAPFGQLVFTNTEHTDWITSLAWSPDGQLIASASYDKTVLVHKVPTGEMVQLYKDHSKLWRSTRVNSLTWSPDGTKIASAGDDKTVQVWDVSTGERQLIYRQHFDRVQAVTWSPDGDLLASASSATIHVWDAITSNTIVNYSGHRNVILALAWSPDGTYLASAGRDALVQVCDATKWDKNAGRLVVYRGHNSYVEAIAWSPDNTRIASASIDDTVQVWDALTGNHILTYYGHSMAIKAVTWSPDGMYIASAGVDETVQIWDALTGDHVFTYSGHYANVYALAWSPDGTSIASGGADNTVQVWRVR